MAYVDQSTVFGYGTQLTSTQMQNLRDNLDATMAKDEGAPVLANGYVVEDMLAATCVTEGKIGASAVAQGKLKTSTGEVSTTDATEHLTLPGGEYGFYPQIKVDGSVTGYGLAYISLNSSSTSYYTPISLQNSSDPLAGTVYAQQRYVTSSGEVFWIFALKNKITGKITAMYCAPDHPCFGNSNNPQKVEHPFPNFDKNKFDIIVITPNFSIVDEIEKNRGIEYGIPVKTFRESLIEIFDIEETGFGIWPDKEVTVGIHQVTKEIIKEKIPKPPYIKMAKLIRK